VKYTIGTKFNQYALDPARHRIPIPITTFNDQTRLSCQSMERASIVPSSRRVSSSSFFIPHWSFFDWSFLSRFSLIQSFSSSPLSFLFCLGGSFRFSIFFFLRSIVFCHMICGFYERQFDNTKQILVRER